jgi:hypothetical protein
MFSPENWLVLKFLLGYGALCLLGILVCIALGKLNE